jgi:hypothetical protein
MGINQLLKWGDRSMFKEATQARNERMLRNAGVAEPRIASVIAMGPNAVFEELLSAHPKS